MMIDTHCHLDIEEYKDVELVINNMGNNIMIASGYNTKTNKRVIELIEKYNNIYGTIGIHPEENEDMNNEAIKYIEENINNPKIVAIGEIGLDYHRDEFKKDLQKEYFIKQIMLANKYNKPIVVHSRDSQKDTYDILKEYKKDNKIVLHCYSYSKESALEFKKLGAKFGIGGVLTFKNGVKLKEVVNCLELEDLLLETDSPYLAPVPFRGTENQPKNILLVAEEIAKIKNIDLEKVLEKTTKNAILEFDLHI